MVFVPITHHLVHAAPVPAARQATHLLNKMMKERGAWPEFGAVVVDVAVEGLVHSKYDLRRHRRAAQARAMLLSGVSLRAAAVVGELDGGGLYLKVSKMISKLSAHRSQRSRKC